MIPIRRGIWNHDGARSTDLIEWFGVSRWHQKVPFWFILFVEGHLAYELSPDSGGQSLSRSCRDKAFPGSTHRKAYLYDLQLQLWVSRDIPGVYRSYRYRTVQSSSECKFWVMECGSFAYHRDLKCAREQKTKRNFGDRSSFLKPGHLSCPLSDMSMRLLMWLSVLLQLEERKLHSLAFHHLNHRLQEIGRWSAAEDYKPFVGLHPNPLLRDRWVYGSISLMNHRHWWFKGITDGRRKPGMRFRMGKAFAQLQKKLMTSS